jgi:hypothetical protein
MKLRAVLADAVEIEGSESERGEMREAEREREAAVGEREKTK